MEIIERLNKRISSLEKTLEIEGVSPKEINETRKIYLREIKEYNQCQILEEYSKYLSVKGDMMKKYWNNRWRF